MNLPNKITISRIILSIIIIIMMILPWSALNVSWPVYLVSDIQVSLKYIVIGILFLIASITDKLDGYLARSRNEVTDYGKMLDSIADKLLVNGVLIILAYERSISIIIPVIIILRDIVVDACKMTCGNKGVVVGASVWGKIKTVCMMCGLTLIFFYNLPFELLHIDFAEYLIIIATILSIISGCLYYFETDKLLKKCKETK